MRRRPVPYLLPILLATALIGLPPDGARGAGASSLAPAAARALAAADCVNGSAAGYPCRNVDLLAELPLSAMGGGSGSGGWGWTDPQTGKEYAIVARSNGTAFVDISNPTSPTYLGNLPSATGTSSWRELNVYNNHVYIVSDNNGSHGMQIFNLTRLRNVTNPPVSFTADARNTSFTNAHTITINYDIRLHRQPATT